MGKKFDITRIYIIIFTIAFAVVFKLIMDNLLPVLGGIPFYIGFAVSPVLALLASQWMIEKKIDGKEIGIFVLMMFIANFLLQLMPSMRDLNLFNLQTTTTTGLIGIFVVYWITILFSVLVSDAITDKGLKLFSR